LTRYLLKYFKIYQYNDSIDFGKQDIFMLSEMQFKELLNRSTLQYQSDNAWWYQPWRCESTVMDTAINEAYRLYVVAINNELPIIPLGGTAIRTDGLLIQNFGITAATGIQTEKIGGAWVTSPLALAGVANAETVRGAGGVSVTGGAILSEAAWNPMLNDALIIAGCTQRLDFQLALTEEEQETWKKLSAVPVLTAWQKLLNDPKLGMIYIKSKEFTGFRVFARELLGLKIFGYIPQIHRDGLFFTPPQRFSVPSEPTFQKYLNGLHAIGFHSKTPDSNILVMKTISKYLFNDPRVLTLPDRVDRTGSYGTRSPSRR
jgi:hypothetical protein